MQKFSLIKFSLFQLLIFAAVVTGFSCMNHSNDSEDLATEKNDHKLENTFDEKDAQFLVKAASINLTEIKLGQLAQQKGTRFEVKDLGKMMESSHKQSLSELASLAEAESVSIPTVISEEGLMEYNQLSKKNGTDFDKEYCQKMVKGHKEAISLFEKAANDSTDPEIQQWATASLPTLREHLEHAKKCDDKCNK